MPRPSPSEGRARTRTVHAVAAVGNAVFVAFLAVLLSHDRLFDSAPAPAPPPAPAVTPRAERVLLVVIDGLRADAAADETLMPALARMRRGGAGGEARVESLIPSTIAGVVALVTGRTSPPAAVVQDLRALPAPDGGVLAAVKAGGGKTFVAGPPVWADLYGRWIDGGYRLPHLVESDDGPLVDAAAAALASGQYQLLVAHLGGPDDVAHVAGTRSRAYAEAAAAADAAVERLLRHTRPGDLLVVTADHGNTDAGGHAGPEEEVVRVPWVAAGPGAGAMVLRRQADFAPVIAAALGGTLAAPTGVERRSRGWLPPSATVLGCGGALLVCAATLRGRAGRLVPTLLNGAVWPALLLVALGYRDAALGVVAAALAASAIACGGWRVTPWPVVLVFVGAGAGLVRLADGTGPTWTAPAARNAAWAVAVAASVAAGYGIGKWANARGGPAAATAGAAALLAALLCGRVAGQTLSLSTLDVRAAYGLSASPLTVPLSVLVAAAIQAAPAAGVVAGLARALRRDDPAVFAAVATGAAATMVGQLLVGSAALASADPTRGAALAMSLLLRVAAEAIFVFLPLALITLRRDRQTPPAEPRPPTRNENRPASPGDSAASQYCDIIQK